jgi:CBS domain-containing protein
MNLIASRLADFLKEYPPFNNLTYPDLIVISMSIRVINLEKNKTLFQINDPLHDSFYVVASGVINLSIISDAEETLLNKCHTGDIFGLRPFFAKNNYMMTAKVREESVLYAIPIAAFRPFVAQNTEVLNFLLESFAMNPQNSSDQDKRGKLISDNVVYSDKQAEIQYFQSLLYNKSPLKTLATTIIKDAAQLMTDNLMNSIIVEHKNIPIGIVTDTNLRTMVATGRIPISETINKVMSSPVITVAQNTSLAEAQLLMLKHNVTHLCVTQDGSDKSEIKGIISEHDLIVAQANNPGVLIKEIRRSLNAKDLKGVREKLSELVQNSITKNIPLPHIFNISGEITSAIARRCIELAILEMGSPPARFAWLCIGSQGRKEQLLLTDQDSFLVFQDVRPDKYRDVKNYFLKLAKKVTLTLENIGYKNCPFGNTASSMSWCKSLSEWNNQYDTWIKTPSKNKNESCSIFFDFEIAYGEIQLEKALSETISNGIKNNQLFFDYLGNDSLRKPTPLNFFKKFNLEEEGPHKDQFDIKTRALMPLIDGARLLILSQNIKGINNTYLRFKQLAMVEPKFSEIYLNCAESFLILTKFRTLEGLKNENTGQFINLEELSKPDKEKLKNCIAPIKELEELIKDKFQLTQFS